MNVRLTPPAGARGAWLIAGRSAAGAVLLAVTLAACSGGSTSKPVFTPTPETSGHVSPTGAPTRTPSPSGGDSTPTKEPTAPPTTATGEPSPTATHDPTITVTPTPTPTHTVTVTAYPTAAPQTGGGGSAGLQDGLLLGVGGVAVVAGLGSLAFRRRLRRKLGADGATPRDPASREPADR
jgi:hypothetical protein